MLTAPVWLPLLSISSCGAFRCVPPEDLPDVPSAMVDIIRVASGAAIGLFTLCLAVAIVFTVTRGWHRQRASIVAATAVCAALCLLIALKASEAYAPFAPFEVAASGYYYDWTKLVGAQAVWDFSSTIVTFRDRLSYLVIIGVVLATTTTVQAARAVRERRRASARWPLPVAPSGGQPAS